jgi:hypothetical protein
MMLRIVSSNVTRMINHPKGSLLRASDYEGRIYNRCCWSRHFTRPKSWQIAMDRLE